MLPLFLYLRSTATACERGSQGLLRSACSLFTWLSAGKEEILNKEVNTIGARIRECRKEMGYSQETLAAMLYMKKTTICKYEKDQHDIPSCVIVELAKALHTTPNYLLLGDIEEDDWMDDMIQMLEKIKKPEYRELAKKQLEVLIDFDK